MAEEKSNLVKFQAQLFIKTLLRFYLVLLFQDLGQLSVNFLGFLWDLQVAVVNQDEVFVFVTRRRWHLQANKERERDRAFLACVCGSQYRNSTHQCGWDFSIVSSQQLNFNLTLFITLYTTCVQKHVNVKPTFPVFVFFFKPHFIYRPSFK